MPWIKRIAAIAIITSFTNGCAMYRLEELRQVTPTGTPFQKALAKLYMDFATEDEKGYDWFNSWYFADKGLRSAYGKDVSPEELANWNIPQAALPELQKAHGELLVALTPHNKETQPELAAQAQFYFDCWVQRQDENWQINRIEYCHAGFIQAMAGLNVPVKEETPPVSTSEIASPKHTHKHKSAKHAEHKTEAKKSAAEKESGAEKKTGSTETLSFVVFFADKQPVITGSGEQVLSDVVKSLAGTANYEIVLKSGAGSDSHSRLFAERAAAVTKRLTDGGIKPDAITTGKAKGAATKHIEIFISQ